MSKTTTASKVLSDTMGLCKKMLKKKAEVYKTVLATYNKLSQPHNDEFIYELTQQGYTQVDIAKMIDKSQSCISRHIDRYKKRLEDT